MRLNGKKDRTFASNKQREIPVIRRSSKTKNSSRPLSKFFLPRRLISSCTRCVVPFHSFYCLTCIQQLALHFHFLPLTHLDRITFDWYELQGGKLLGKIHFRSTLSTHYRFQIIVVIFFSPFYRLSYIHFNRHIFEEKRNRRTYRIPGKKDYQREMCLGCCCHSSSFLLRPVVLRFSSLGRKGDEEKKKLSFCQH